MYKKQSLLLSVLFLLTAMSCAYADSPAAKAKGSAPLAVKTAPAVTAKTTAPAVKMKKVPQTAAVKKAPLSLAAEMALPVIDIDESYDLPEYPMGARVAMGQQKTYTIGEEDTVLDVARYFGLGFVETRAANPELDPWTAVAGEKVLIPGFKLLPRTRQDGVVVNLAQMRMYYFRYPGREPVSFPIGIGREGLQTPTGDTTIVRKVAGPVWFPTARMREEKPFLPVSVPAGPSNPLGTHALYLGWPTFLIHGSNKPWAIGRRVSSGCMRMYPEDIIELFNIVPVGTRVTVVDQPILVGWIGHELYLEANPSKTQSNDIEIDGAHVIKPLNDKLVKVIADAAGVAAKNIDWDLVKTIVEERRGYPFVIATDRAVSVTAAERAMDKKDQTLAKIRQKKQMADKAPAPDKQDSSVAPKTTVQYNN